MSLPTATKEISEKPAKTSVIDPVNKADKDADVDRKLRFYGVIEAFRQGRMPSNAQIDETLNYVRNHSPVNTSELSPEGQKLVNDVRDVIETARLIVKEKNADELFQNFIWHTRSTEFDRAKQDPNEVAPISKEQARTEGQEALKHLRTLFSLVATNSEVRKLLSDFTIIGRDLLARGASKVADNTRPTPEQLARTDDAAPADTFVDKDGNQVPAHQHKVELAAKVPGTDKTVVHDPKAAPDAANATRVVEGDGTVKPGPVAADEARAKKEEGKAVAKDAADAHAIDVQRSAEAAPPGQEGEAAKGNLKSKILSLRDNLTDRIPQQHKDTAQGHYDRAREFLTEEYFPEERRDQFIYRLKKVVVECQKHNDYQESIRWLISYLETYANHGKAIGDKGKESHNALFEDPALNTAVAEIRTLLERFANGRPFSTITDAAQKLYDDADKDEGLRNWFKAVDEYVRKVLLEPGYVLEPACDNRGRELRETGRQYYDGKYKAHFDGLFNAFGDWFKAMGDDPLNARFGQDWARLTKDLLFDSEGSLKFKPALWNDIRSVILPTLVDRVGYIPIPRIEYTDDSLDLVIENLTLSGRNLFPNIVGIESHNKIKFSPYKNIKDEGKHELTLTFAQIQADIRDMAIYFKRKTGPVKIKDSGIADVFLGGEGITITATITSVTKDPRSVYSVKKVNTKVDALKFSIRDSKHDLLYKTVKPLIMGLVKKQIEKAVSDAVRTGLEYVDGQLVGVRQRMDEAKAKDGEAGRMAVLKSAFEKKEQEVGSIKSKAESRFNVVSKRDSVILPEAGHPAGWVNRQQERADASKEGDGWHSKAFNIIPGKHQTADKTSAVPLKDKGAAAGTTTK